jgi:hypothetical protein
MKSKITFHGVNMLFNGKKWLILLFTVLLSSGLTYSQVAINTDNSAPDASAMLDVKATGMGLLAPRMTFANRPAAPATGLLIYQTDNSPGFYYYTGSAWTKVVAGAAGDSDWLYFSGSGNTGVIYHAGDVAMGTYTDADGHGLNVQNYTSGKGAVRGADESGGLYAEGLLGVLSPSFSYPLPASIVNAGVLGWKPASGSNGAAVLGGNVDDNSANYGGFFFANGDGGATNYGVWARADSGSTANYAGYFVGRVRAEGHTQTDGSPDYNQTVIYGGVTHGVSSDTRAVEGFSNPVPGYGIGVYGTGGYRGVQGYGDGGTYTGTSYGVYGYTGGTGVGTRIGIYGSASGGATNWAGYFSGDVYVSSDMRIATTIAATGYELSVNGQIACEELLIDDSAFWPDYVFEDDYDLMSIDEFEASIKENGHLPGMTSANEVSENGGFHVGDTQKKTLEKVEELSLYIIELNNRVKKLEQENQTLKNELSN